MAPEPERSIRVRMEAGRSGEGKNKNLSKIRKTHTEDAGWRLPLVGDDPELTVAKKVVDRGGLLMEGATVMERVPDKKTEVRSQKSE